MYEEMDNYSLGLNNGWLSALKYCLTQAKLMKNEDLIKSLNISIDRLSTEIEKAGQFNGCK